MFPEVTITVGRTHWRCITCKLLNKRVVSIDQHIKSKHTSLQETTKQSGISKSAVHESNSYSDGEIETGLILVGRISTHVQKDCSNDDGHSFPAKKEVSTKQNCSAELAETSSDKSVECVAKLYVRSIEQDRFKHRTNCPGKSQRKNSSKNARTHRENCDDRISGNTSHRQLRSSNRMERFLLEEKSKSDLISSVVKESSSHTDSVQTESVYSTRSTRRKLPVGQDVCDGEVLSWIKNPVRTSSDRCQPLLASTQMCQSKQRPAPARQPLLTGKNSSRWQSQNQTRNHVSKKYKDRDTKYMRTLKIGSIADTNSLQDLEHCEKPLVHIDPPVFAAAATDSTGACRIREVKTDKCRRAKQIISKKRKLTKQDPETVVVKKCNRVDFNRLRPGRMAAKRRDLLDSEKKFIKENYVVFAGMGSLMEPDSKPTQQPPHLVQTEDTSEEVGGDQASIQADDIMQKLQLVDAWSSSLPQGVHDLTGTKARNGTSLELNSEGTQLLDFTASQPEIDNSHLPSDTDFFSSEHNEPQTNDPDDTAMFETDSPQTLSDSQLSACGFHTSDLYQLSIVNAPQIRIMGTPHASNRETNPPQIFNCTICSAKFSCLESFAMHKNEVAAYGVTECRKCTKSFHGVHLLNVHVFGEHEVRKKGFCFECGQVFDSMEKLERHCYSHVLKRECPLTEMRFHECKICSREILGEYAIMQSHYNARHKANLCFDCYIKSDIVYFTNPTENKEHKQTHEKVCALCSLEFTSRDKLLTHYFEHSNSPGEMENGSGMVCDKCGQWCANRRMVTVHDKRHELQKARKRRSKDALAKFTCLQCDKVYNSQKNLNWHTKIAHVQNRTYNFRCEFCGKGVDSQIHLQDHIALHHLGVKRYACEYCDQRFVCRPTLRRHVLREHEKDKQYRCEFCGESFCEKSKLQRHTYIHTGRARFVCEHCGKGFHTGSALRTHMTVHEETRDFVCQHCGQGYKR